MRFRDEAVHEITGKLQQLGLDGCPVCGSETALQADRRPVLLTVGQLSTPDTPRPKEKSGNALFMVRIECNLCGYSILFNSERFFSGDTPILEQD